MTINPTPAMERFLGDIRKAIEEEMLATDGFARAFVDATGFKPEECEMVVATSQEIDGTGSRSMMRRIWFERRDA